MRIQRAAAAGGGDLTSPLANRMCRKNAPVRVLAVRTGAFPPTCGTVSTTGILDNELLLGNQRPPISPTTLRHLFSMNRPPRNIVVLGSTGSIGSSTLEVAAASEGQLQVVGLSANRSCQRLLEQARRLRPRWVAVTDEESGRQFDWSELPKETRVAAGDGGHGADDC